MREREIERLVSSPCAYHLRLLEYLVVKERAFMKTERLDEDLHYLTRDMHLWETLNYLGK